MCNMFLTLKATYFAGYANEKIPFAVGDNKADVIKTLNKIG